MFIMKKEKLKNLKVKQISLTCQISFHSKSTVNITNSEAPETVD